MGPIPFALSVHHFINSVGADAGFASIIGLAILVLLYFAQARETASLREQAYEWAQRVQQLEARIAQLAARQQQVTQAPTPAPAPALGRTTAAGASTASRFAGPVPAGVGVPAAGPTWAPAGVAAPALTAATKLIPTSPAPPEPPTPLQAPDAPLDLTSIESPAPATVAGGANGHMQGEPVGAVPPPAHAAGSPPPRIQIRPAGAPAGTVALGRRGVPPPRGQQPRGQSRARRVIAAIAVLLIVGGGVAAVLIATKGNSNKNKASGQSTTQTGGRTTVQTTKRKRGAQAAAVNPASVTVAVLNGTATNQLAHRVALKLGAAGYKQGLVTTAADQTHTSTIVAYMPNAPNGRRAALAVAKSLGLPPTAVATVDPSTQAVACPAGTPCTANVVVTVGSNLANIQ